MVNPKIPTVPKEKAWVVQRKTSAGWVQETVPLSEEEALKHWLFDCLHNPQLELRVVKYMTILN